MAIQKNIKINVDTGQAVKDVDKLDDSFKNLDNQTEKTSAGLKDVGENGGAIAILDSLTGGTTFAFTLTIEDFVSDKIRLSIFSSIIKPSLSISLNV